MPFKDRKDEEIYEITEEKEEDIIQQKPLIENENKEFSDDDFTFRPRRKRICCDVSSIPSTIFNFGIITFKNDKVDVHPYYFRELMINTSWTQFSYVLVEPRIGIPPAKEQTFTLKNPFNTEFQNHQFRDIPLNRAFYNLLGWEKQLKEAQDKYNTLVDQNLLKKHHSDLSTEESNIFTKLQKKLSNAFSVEANEIKEQKREHLDTIYLAQRKIDYHRDQIENLLKKSPVLDLSSNNNSINS